MSDQENIGRIRQFVSDFNHENMDRLAAYLSPQFFNYVPKEGEKTQTEVIAGFLADFQNAGSNVRMSIDNLTANEAGVLRGQLSLRGQHTGPIWGVPATGNSFEMMVDMAIKEIDGRFAIAIENTPPPKAQAILRQVKLVPPRMDLPAEHPVVHPEILLKVLFTGQVADKPCSHLDMIQVMEPETDVCEQCAALGDIWPALRMCLVCGFVGCCDASKNKHMKAHFEVTGHCIFRSVRLDERWGWCYEDAAFLSSARLAGHLG